MLGILLGGRIEQTLTGFLLLSEKKTPSICKIQLIHLQPEWESCAFVYSLVRPTDFGSQAGDKGHHPGCQSAQSGFHQKIKLLMLHSLSHRVLRPAIFICLPTGIRYSLLVNSSTVYYQISKILHFLLYPNSLYCI